MTQRNKIIFSLIVVLILAGVYVLFDKRSDIGENANNEAIATTTTSTTTASDDKIITGSNSGYTIEQVPIEEGRGIPQPIPDLNRKIIVSANATVTAEAKAFSETKVSALQDKLRNNPADLESWIYLGIYQKQGGDYVGASMSWMYASKLAPTDFVSLGNLGNLYAYFIKDNAMAENFYKQAIVKGPTQVNLYTQLAEVYIYIFKDTTKARAIIEQGLSKVPNDPNLLQLKASLN